MTFDIHDPNNIWVAPDADERGIPAKDGTGTFESPFASIQDALKKAGAGNSVILMPGVYDGNLTIEISGTENSPVYITAQEPKRTVIENGCWYFYDTCDLVVSNLTFKNAKRGAVSVVGECLRNRFHSLKFIDCGAGEEDTCTFYFGGTGARFNIIEDCEFLRGSNFLEGKHITAALMVSDGGDGDFLMNHVLRRNNFCGYDRAIIIGSGKSELDFESGHIAERNVIENCRDCGITVTCRDVQVRANVIKNCGVAGIKLDGGGYSVISGNKICGCGIGVSVVGAGHTVCDNIIAACKSAINSSEESAGLIIDNNTVAQNFAESDFAIDDDDDDSSYASAFMQSHDDDEEVEQKNEVEEISVLDYMFHLDEE